jgi:hypothetical protein
MMFEKRPYLVVGLWTAKNSLELRVGGANNGTGLTAWVIDSGVDTDHPDL